MKKIAIVSNTSWSIFNFRLNLARAIQKQGYIIILIAPFDQYSKRLESEFEYYNIQMNNKGINPIEDIQTTLQFYKLYKQIKPDILLHFTIKPNIYGTLAGSLLGIKSINNIAGLGTLFIKQNIITNIAKLLYKYSQKKANKVFFQNTDDFTLFTNGKLVDKSKSGILPGSGVDTEKFKPLTIEKKQDNIFKFLFIARLIWDKGIGEYVDSAKLIKDKYQNIEFQVLGFIGVNNPNAISKDEIDNWVTNKYINYLGASDNVIKFIDNADCIVLPSYYREGTPRVLLESASMEKPLITTNSVGCKDVVDDRVNGFLCEIKNSKDLAEKMELMINLSKEDRITMGKNGRKKVLKEFDEKIVIMKYMNTILKLSSI